MSVRMFVSDLVIDAKTKSPVVVLQDSSGEFELPIFIGLMEASAIASVREKVALPRPMTHDLLCTLLDSLDGDLVRVEVTELRDNTFYALLHLTRGGQPLRLDSRPSDAIALALRADAPIMVREAVLAEAGTRRKVETDKWKQFLENRDPEEFGGYKQ